QLAVSYHQHGELLRSLEISTHAIARARELNDTATLSQALIHAANSLFFIGSHERAVSYLTEVLEIAHREGNDSYVGQTLVGLSEIALAQGDPESAFAYALEAVNSKGSRQWAQWRALYLRQLANSM